MDILLIIVIVFCVSWKVVSWLTEDASGEADMKASMRAEGINDGVVPRRRH